jgi:hypothetical protein
VKAAPKGRRTALSQLGGDVELAGDAELAETLRDAFDVVATETAELADVHGFHSYPARMHPDTAQRLIGRLSTVGQTVLDPFCGSGTVLVEARRLGRRGLGYDVNPLSRELSWLKTLGPDDAWLAALGEEATRVAAHADERRRAKAGATQRYGDADRAQFAAHVLLELDGLRDGIQKTERPELRRALFLVLSALLTKVSQKSGDSGARTTEKRVAPGFPSRFFVKKTAELCRQLAAYRDALPADAPDAVCTLGDAKVARAGRRLADAGRFVAAVPGRLRLLDAPRRSPALAGLADARLRAAGNWLAPRVIERLLRSGASALGARSGRDSDGAEARFERDRADRARDRRLDLG